MTRSRSAAAKASSSSPAAPIGHPNDTAASAAAAPGSSDTAIPALVPSLDTKTNTNPNANTNANANANANTVDTYQQWLERKQQIEDRLTIISVPPLSTARTKAKPGGSSAAGGGGGKKRTRRGTRGSRAASEPSPAAAAAAVASSSPAASSQAAATAAASPSPATNESTAVPYVPKPDVHWDFLLKELAWLGTDFGAERKRQVAAARKLGASVLKFHQTREARRIRALQRAEAGRRKLASKLGRDVRSWWTKLEKIVAYKQKLSADRERQKSMNQQLVRLVKQTEKYTESLSNRGRGGGGGVAAGDGDGRVVSTEDDEDEEDTDTDNDNDNDNDDEETRNRRRRRRRRRRRVRRPRPELTIEQALAMASGKRRKTKSRFLDYSRMKLDEDEFYGTSTAEDDGSLGSEAEPDDEYSPPLSDAEGNRNRNRNRNRNDGSGDYDDDSDDDNDSDDETTLRMAMQEEMAARKRRKQHQSQNQTQHQTQTQNQNAHHDGQTKTRGAGSDDESVDSYHYSADPEELRKLREEQDMDIEEVLKRLREEEEEEAEDEAEEEENEEDTAMEVDATNEPKQEQPVEESTQQEETKSVKQVHFEEQTRATTAPAEDPASSTSSAAAAAAAPATPERAERPPEDPGEDADDDGDASDVEDYLCNLGNDDDDDGDDAEEYRAREPEPDDETTLEAEERLGRDTTYEEEIEMLKRENELSVEELRALYGCAREENAKESRDEDEDSVDANAEDSSPPPDKSTKASGEPSENNEGNDRDEAAATTLESAKQSDEATEEEEEDAGSDGGNPEDDEEFEADQNEVDDETTMIAEEQLGRDMTYEEEIAMLNRENELSVEELRAMYAGMNNEDDDPTESSENDERELREEDDSEGNGSNPEGDEEFEADPNEADDETTMIAEEKLGRDMTYEEELAMLNRENELSVEELRAMYAGMNDDAADDNEDRDGTGSRTDGTVDVPEGESAKSDEKPVHERSDNPDEVQSASDDDGEFEMTGEPEADDETTMIAEEKLGRDMTYEEELAMLNRENELSVEELRAMYAGMNDDGEHNESLQEGSGEGNQDDDNATMADEPGPRPDGTKKRTRDSPEDSSLLHASGDIGSNKRARKKEQNSNDASESSENDGTAAMEALEASAVKARETLASRPFLLAPWVKLRRYQQVGLNWLVSLQSRRLNGILADEMGLGKTLQTISLLAYLASYKGIWGPHLVIVPTSVIINWETELKRFCPGFKILCYYGNAKRRKELRTGWTKANWYHVVITSYQLAVQDAFAFKRKKWYYLILDEAQNIKNFQSQRWQTLINFNTQRRLLLTGTPLQNNLMELWSLLHFLMPYIFKSRKEFSYWFSNPMNNIIEGTANQNTDVIKRLHGIIRPFVLRRLKKEVETQMPGKFEHIVKCQLSRRQMTLYEEFLSRSSTRQALKKGGNFMGMMNVLMQLRKVCNHPDLFEPRSVVTPFVLPSIAITTPRCVCEIQREDGFLESVSLGLAKPLWCGSSSKPSIEAALRHNQTESNGLSSFCASVTSTEKIEFRDDGNCPTELQSLIQQIYKAREEEQVSRTNFHNAINRRRCKASTFPYSSQLLQTVEVECNVFGRVEPTEVRNRRVIETPAKLLELRKTEMDRACDMEQTIEKFVFRVPPAGGRYPNFDNGMPDTQGESKVSKDLERMLLEPIEEILEPYRKARARLSSFFPDKKLVQYDAGKLQALSTLLRTLKEGGHKCLIFTQMGKVLDVLEAFLSMNGHTYLRLDGSTGVDKRQRLMDRFNNDPKIFCFILSTRSGGTGINLTGADTVIFYDSDWNPAMDAQAQDRAHRIGQTRDVHIYRLITEHSIEENILKKAQKKKNLDIMVMDRGKFNASTPASQKEDANKSEDVKDVYTKKGLQAILGFADDEPDPTSQEEENTQHDMSKDEMEEAMAALEDEDDAKALQGAKKEAEEDQKEFDETSAIPKEGSDDDDEDADKAKTGKGKRTTTKTKGKTDPESKKEGEEQNSDEKDLEKEFAAWQSTEGFDAKAIDNFLSPMERYGLNFREEIDPFYSIFYLNEQQRKMEIMEGAEEIDMEEVERQKAMEEQQAIDNQDLLATGIRPEDLVRQRNLYRREKIRLRSDKMRRKITGELWSQKVDGLTKMLFWYNEETGEAIWDTPLVVAELQEQELALREGWGHLPLKPLTRIMEYLVPFPERQRCSAVCRQWRIAATDIRFVIHVYPVEMGALAKRDPSKRHHNHHATIDDALAKALPGDTIELGDGHYWVNDPGFIVDKPLRFVGDENNPSNVVIEMSGSLQWTAKGGWIEGITFRRPKMSSGKALPSCPMLELGGAGRIDMIHSVFDNDGSTGPVGKLYGSGMKGRWQGVVLRNGGASGIHLDGSDQAKVELLDCTIKGNQADGIFATNKAKFRMINCLVDANHGYGVRLATAGCHADLLESRFKDNASGVIKKETHCVVTSSGNTAFLKTKPKRQIPGFKLMLFRTGPPPLGSS